MKRVIYLATARRDLRQLRAYLTEASRSPNVSRNFLLRIRSYCDHLASLPFEMGRERPELAPNLPSAVFEDYVIFFRYIEDRFAVVNIVEGHRDMTGYFLK